jgi:hypothetical protein
MEVLANDYDSPEIVSDDGNIEPIALVLVNVNVFDCKFTELLPKCQEENVRYLYRF